MNDKDFEPLVRKLKNLQMQMKILVVIGAAATCLGIGIVVVELIKRLAN